MYCKCKLWLRWKGERENVGADEVSLQKWMEIWFVVVVFVVVRGSDGTRGGRRIERGVPRK